VSTRRGLGVNQDFTFTGTVSVWVPDVGLEWIRILHSQAPWVCEYQTWAWSESRFYIHRHCECVSTRPGLGVNHDFTFTGTVSVWVQDVGFEWIRILHSEAPWVCEYQTWAWSESRFYIHRHRVRFQSKPGAVEDIATAASARDVVTYLYRFCQCFSCLLCECLLRPNWKGVSVLRTECK
jgi:hypothetical protein